MNRYNSDEKINKKISISINPTISPVLNYRNIGSSNNNNNNNSSTRTTKKSHRKQLYLIDTNDNNDSDFEYY